VDLNRNTNRTGSTSCLAHPRPVVGQFWTIGLPVAHHGRVKASKLGIMTRGETAAPRAGGRVRLLRSSGCACRSRTPDGTWKPRAGVHVDQVRHWRAMPQRRRQGTSREPDPMVFQDPCQASILCTRSAGRSLKRRAHSPIPAVPNSQDASKSSAARWTKVAGLVRELVRSPQH